MVDNNEVGGFANVTEAFGKAFKALGIIDSTPEDIIHKAQKDIGNALASSLQQSLSILDVNLKQHTFIPPGGGVFTFQNPAFSNAGDLFFEVIYRAP